MAIIGQGVQAGLGRVDYTPYLQGAIAGAQGIAQGIAGVGKSAADAIQEYQKNKAANAVLEGENASMLRRMAGNPQLSGYVPDQDMLNRLSEKMIKGGLSLTENKKLNAELNTAYKLYESDTKMAQQQLYANVAAENVKMAALDRARKEQENKAIDAFNTELSGISNPSADDIYNIGAKNKTPVQYVNAALSGKIDVNRYNMAVKSFETEQIAAEQKIRAGELDLQKMQALAKRVQELGGKADVKASVVNGATVFELTTPEGQTKFEVLRAPAAPKPTVTENVSNAVAQYIESQDKKDPVLRDAAVSAYAKAMGFQGPGFTKEAVEEPLKQLADETRKSRGGVGGATMAAPANAAGVKTITRVQGVPPSQAPQQPAATPAQTTNVQPVQATTGAVAQTNLPPKLPTANTEQLGASGNAELQAFLASRAAASPAVSDTQLTQAVIAAAPQAPIVDTNLEPSRLAYIPRSPAGAPQYGTMYQEAGFNYPAASVFGAAERVAGALGPVSQQIQVPGRLLNELGRYGSAALTGVVTGDYTVPSQGIVDIGSENLAKYLSGSNAAGETVRTIGYRYGMVPDMSPAPEATNSISATLDALAAGMTPRKSAGQPVQATAPRPMQSAELPQIKLNEESKRIAEMLLKEYEGGKGGKPPTPEIKAGQARMVEAVGRMLDPTISQIKLSTESKRIADLLLQEYENSKGGKPPSFTITAERKGGEGGSVTITNPAILAVLSNPASLERLVREQGATVNVPATNIVEQRSTNPVEFIRLQDQMRRELMQLERGRRPARGR